MRKLLLLCFAPLLIGGQAAPPKLDGETPIVSNGVFSLSLQSAPNGGAIPGSAHFIRCIYSSRWDFKISKLITYPWSDLIHFIINKIKIV